MHLIIILLVSLLVGCDLNDAYETYEAFENSRSESSPDYSVMYMQPSGRWSSECHRAVFANEDENIWAISIYEFNNGVLIKDVEVFSDSACQYFYDGENRFWTEIRGNLTFLKHIETTNGLKANWYSHTSNVSSELPHGIKVEFGLYFDLYSMNIVSLRGGHWYIEPLVYRLEH